MYNLRNKMSYVHINFSGLPWKLYVPHTAFLEFQLLFRHHLLLRIFRQTAYFSTLFHETNYSNRINKLYKIKETKCPICAWIFLAYRESTYICRFGVFQLSCIMMKMYIRLYCTDQVNCANNRFVGVELASKSKDSFGTLSKWWF